MNFFGDTRFYLASASPRRQQLLKELGIDFEVKLSHVSESYPAEIHPTMVPLYLAQKKTLPLGKNLNHNEVLIAADTVVILEGEILGKPQNYQEAFEMLSKLSGQKHQVVTGVCLSKGYYSTVFGDTTYVTFGELSQQTIHYYIENYKPFDKAGAYGIQEWIGMIGVSKIEGSFYNVMGLPLEKLWHELLSFIGN